MTKVSTIGKEYLQTAKITNARAKELRKEFIEAKKYERDSKILSIYGENPETGKRSAVKLIGMSLLTSPLLTAYFCNKADKIQMKRDIAELKGQVEEHRKSTEIYKDMFLNVYGKHPETGKRDPIVYFTKGYGLPYTIIADKINAKKAEAVPPKADAAPATEEDAAEEV
ncbi:hypothetical protein II906_06795 [bacterium]|nr:hypothetical protein [bacterium]